MRVCLFFVSLLLAATAGRGQNLEKPATKQATRPRVVVIGVNGMELDVIRPLLLKGAMPNLEHVINNGAYGKLRTVSAPRKRHDQYARARVTVDDRRREKDRHLRDGGA